MRRRQLGRALILAGSVVVLASLLIPWYSWSAEGTGGGSSFSFSESYGVTLLPGAQYRAAYSWSCSGNQSICSRSNGFGPTGETQHPYSDQLTHTGSVYLAIAVLGFAAGAAGLSWVLVEGLRSRRPRTRRSFERWTAMVAPVLGAITIVVAVVGTPSSLSADKAGIGSGPWASFTGSCSWSIASQNSTGCEIASRLGAQTMGSWGPDAGWFLGLAATVLLFAGVFVALSAMTGSPQPDSVSSLEGTDPKTPRP